MPVEVYLPFEAPEVALGHRQQPVSDGVNALAAAVLASLTRDPFLTFFKISFSTLIDEEVCFFCFVFLVLLYIHFGTCCHVPPLHLSFEEWQLWHAT